MALAMKTSKNQITLSKKIADQFPGIEYFEVPFQGGAIQLFPVDLTSAVRVREKLPRMLSPLPAGLPGRK